MRQAAIVIPLLLGLPASAHPLHRRSQAVLPGMPLPRATTRPITIHVEAGPGRRLNRFRPNEAFGAGVDGVPTPAVREIYRPATVRRLLAAGLGPVSYRLYTELSVQDWHWNPAGSFSEPGGHGYWTSDSKPGIATVDTYGYRLPRRGNTHDQGSDDSYSRLDDGDGATIWKSNPYLASAFTGESDALHPQWVLVDLGAARPVNAARVSWAAPYALQYRLQYWTGADAIGDPANGRWMDLPAGIINDGSGGTVTVALGAAPSAVRTVRVLMTQSSGTCAAPHTDDRRDCVGYAMAEIGIGRLDAAGTFTDFVTHHPDRTQTVIVTSSTDAWHRQADRTAGQEQPGLDTVFGSGITRGLPATIPVPMLYSTPANAAAEITYLEARGDRIARVELGEEPDGEAMLPEDYAALYVQFADAIHRVDSKLVLGGPVFQSNLTDVSAWPDADGQTSWTRRFLSYLAGHHRAADLGFFSFEHYPFDACGNAQIHANLLQEPKLLGDIMQVWRADGIGAATPIVITEANYSSSETDAAQLPAGAIWLADFYGSLLSAGGAGAFFYEYEPIPLSPAAPCPGYGSYGLLLGDAYYRPHARLAQFFAAQMLTTRWVQAGNAINDLYRAQSDSAWVTAYPVRRPDRTWGVLLVNRDLAAPHDILLDFTTPSGVTHFAGPVSRTSFGAEQYAWIEAGAGSHPSPDGPAIGSMVPGGAGVVYRLPKASITVLGGSLEQ